MEITRDTGNTYLPITPQLQILLWPEHPPILSTLLQLLPRRRRFNALRDIAEDLAGAQHAICIEAVIAEVRVSGGGRVEGEREGNVPVGGDAGEQVLKGLEDEGDFDYLLGGEVVLCC